MLKTSLIVISALVLSQAVASTALASDFNNGGANVLVSSDLGEILAEEGYLLPTLAEWSGGVGTLKGETAYIGRGCAADDVFAGPDDAYLADPAGKIALIDRGACFFTTKIMRAAAAGAIGVIVINVAGDPSYGTGDWRIAMEGPVSTVDIPAVFVGHSDGVALAAAPVKVVLQYKAFTLLKDAVDAVPSLLSDAEKMALKELVSQAANAIKKKNLDFSGAADLITEFQGDVVTYYFEGEISLQGAEALYDSADTLIYRLSTVP